MSGHVSAHICGSGVMAGPRVRVVLRIRVTERLDWWSKGFGGVRGGMIVDVNLGASPT